MIHSHAALQSRNHDRMNFMHAFRYLLFYARRHRPYMIEVIEELVVVDFLAETEHRIDQLFVHLNRIKYRR